MKNPLDQLVNRFVCVEGGGVRYFGTLVEIGEEELMLKSTTRWVSVALDRVVSVREVDPAELEGPVEQIDSQEYAADDGGEGERSNDAQSSSAEDQADEAWDEEDA